ncbi:HET-s domain protein [Colletotrichum scovillei]|uniref:HET-s domain protein n=1 Tax=Colletotrichum scovillei TaxID=1209932 RepID=UPI0015C2D7ED|nr:HET-s domain protein [Colletotrichum scovillei]KAF4773323.1 HET-s domain protein [Colletotrichum scovillei]
MATGIEIAGILLASAGAAHQLFDCGRKIYRRIKDEKKLNRLLSELKMFEVDDQRQMLNNYVESVQPVLRTQLIKKEDKDRLLRRWERIKQHLIRIDELIDIMIMNSSLLDTITRRQAKNELRELGNTGVLTVLLAQFRDDASLLEKLASKDQSTFLSGRDFIYIDDTPKKALGKDTMLRKGRWVAAGSNNSNRTGWFLVESKLLKSDYEKQIVKEDVATLANRLERAQKNRGIFKLVGFREEKNPQMAGFELIFDGEFDGKVPVSLSAYMQTHSTKPSLNFRIDLCCQLATAVLETQSLRLVHKNIRPDNILVMENISSPLAKLEESIPMINLSGWQYARHVDEGYITTLGNAMDLERKIYQHPERQIRTSERDYSMAHDIYSLGVCMIEILCWKSLLQTREDDAKTVAVSDDFVNAFKALGFSPHANDVQDDWTKFPRQNKAVLQELNATCVPVESGTKMAQIIHGFLTSLDRKVQEDEENDSEEEEQEEEDSIGVYALNGEEERRTQAIEFMDTSLKDLQSFLQVV